MKIVQLLEINHLHDGRSQERVRTDSESKDFLLASRSALGDYYCSAAKCVTPILVDASMYF